MSDVPLLQIEDLHVEVEGTPILKGVDLTIRTGEMHAIMGRNGSGKSTLAATLMGHPAYEVVRGRVMHQGEDLLAMEPFERARAGMFLSFQYPSAVPGVQVGTFLRKAVSAVHGEDALSGKALREAMREAMDALGIERSFLARYVNDGFSGGEKKRLEMLQMALLRPTMIVLDEVDSGLDIDALKAVASGIATVAPSTGSLVITHYKRLLDHLSPQFVHAMIDGRLVRSGDISLAEDLEERGYDWLEVAA